MTGALRRFRLSELLGFVAVIAAGLAAMRDGPPTVLCATYTLTFVVILIALFAGWASPEPRPGCRGFAFFGGAYFLISFIPALQTTIGRELPTAELFQSIGLRFHRPPPDPPSLTSRFRPMYTTIQTALELSRHTPHDPAIDAYVYSYRVYMKRVQNAKPIADLLLCWVFGMMGFVLGRFLAFRRQPEGPESA
jgi:hypothetical protein